MRIAQVDVNFNFSSTGKIVADLLKGLDKLGHSTVAFYGRGPDVSNMNVHRISSGFGVLAHALGTRITGLTDGFSPLATKRLLAGLDTFVPDVVHLHDLHGYFVDIEPVVAYLKAKRIPTVWTFHSEFMYTGKCGSAIECDKWKVECNKCPKLGAYPKSWFFDFTTRMFRKKQAMFEGFDRLHLVAPSSWLAERMRQSIIRDKPISVVHNGLDTTIFRPRDASRLRSSLGLNNEYVVLAVGSDLLSDNKGGHWVLEIARRSSTSNTVFVMVGVDEVPRDVPNNVRIIPRVFNQELLSEYYSLADLLLLTSARETFSMVCAEGLACGTPVIGFHSGAPSEVAPPGYGEFVPYADLDGLESLLFKVKAGDFVFNSSAECERFARDQYSGRSMVNSYEDIYRRLIGDDVVTK